MKTEDPRLHIIEVDGQQLYVPSSEVWAELWKDPTLDCWMLPVPDILRTKVQAIVAYPEITAALGFAFNRVHFYELLRVNGTFYRVFIEAVCCDYCQHRAVISATPAVQEIYWGARNEAAAQDRSRSFPLQSCFACKKPLSRRATVWQFNA